MEKQIKKLQNGLNETSRHKKGIPQAKKTRMQRELKDLQKKRDEITAAAPSRAAPARAAPAAEAPAEAPAAPAEID